MAEQKLFIESIVLADYAVEAKDGKKSLVGIFDKIFAAEFPSMRPNIWMYMTLRGKEEQKEKVRVWMHGPDNEGIGDLTVEIDVDPNQRATVLINMEQFPLPNPGEYHIHVAHGENELAVYSFDVIRVKKENDTIVD